VLFQTTKETEANPASDPLGPGAETARQRKGRVLLVEDEEDLVSSLS
jgi:hypothetical protein